MTLDEVRERWPVGSRWRMENGGIAVVVSWYENDQPSVRFRWEQSRGGDRYYGWRTWQGLVRERAA